LPKIKIPLWLAILIGRFFDVFNKLIGKDLPINSDRMKKFGTATDYRAEKIRELGYVQQHSIKEVLDKTCKWYKEINEL
jgi:nucleoside-diphosphate-sugar epimerase